MSEIPNIVIDTQLLLRAVVNRRSLAAKLIYDMTDSYTLLISEGTLAEITDVLSRPKVRAKFQYSDEAITQLKERLSRGILVTVDHVPEVARDPKDDIFLATAVVGKAQYIVSEDKDLLVLNPYKSIQIVSLPDFMKAISPSLDEPELPPTDDAP